MARKKGEEEACGNWMDTYGDMVTLLLTFFIMLYSMSSINEEKWEKVVKAFANSGSETQQVVTAPYGSGSDLATNQGDYVPAGAQSVPTMENPPENFDELYEYLQSYVASNNMEGSVEVTQGDGNVYVRFQDNVLYDPDSSELKPTGIKVLEFIGTGLVGVQEQIMTINIAGHTAAVPNAETYRISDWDLSAGRAASVAIYLEEEMGLEPKKLMPIGYGKNSPIADNETMEGRQKNRRVDMTIVSKDSQFSNEDAIRQFLAGTFDANRYPSSGGAAEILMPDLVSSQGKSSSSSNSSESSETSSSDTSTEVESNSLSSDSSGVAPASEASASGSSAASSASSASSEVSSIVEAVPMSSSSASGAQSGVSPYSSN